MLSKGIARSVAALLVGTLVIAAVPAAPANVSTAGEEVRSLNGEALRLQSEARRAKTTTLEGRAAKSLERRQKTLQALIERDPTTAAAIALPGKVLKQLGETFPTQQARFEQRGSWDGELEFLIEDGADLKSHRNIFRLHRGAETLDLRFAGRAPPRLKSGQKLTVKGVRALQTVAATEVEVLDAFLGGSAGTAAAQNANALAQCGPTGPQSVLTVLVNLPGYKLPGAVTADFMRGVLFGNSATSATSNPDWSVDGFWQQASDGRAWVDPGSTVVGPIALTSNFNTNTSGASSCDTYGMRDAVIAAIDGQVDFRNYSRILIVTPGNGACSWAGTANVGCRVMSSNGDGEFTASVAWQRAESMATRAAAVQLTTHELGHNLTLSHAGSRDFGSEALGPVGVAGTIAEYGDPFSTMGAWNFGFYAASQAANQLQWLGAGSNYTVVETSGTYTIQGFETRPAGVKALKVRRGTGDNSWLWLESRQNVGDYSSRLDPSAFRGALVHFEDATTGNDSHLLDFTTGTTSFTDAPMPAGSSWTDPYSNLSVTVNSVSSAGMTVTVNYGSATCTAAAPTVTLSPVAASAEQGGTARLALTVKNNSTQACPAESFAITAAAPGGWTARPVTPALTLNPGQQSQTTISVAVPAGFALGTYALSASARGSTSALATTANANVTVTEPPASACATAAPSLTVSPTRPAVAFGSSTRVAIALLNNNPGTCASESFAVSATGPASWSYAIAPASISVASATEGQTELTLGVPDSQAPGAQTVLINVRNASGNLVATQSVTVDITKPPEAVCTRVAPAVSLSPSDVTLEQGGAIQLSFTVKNGSSAACGAESFSLGAKVPTGWSDAFGGNSISLDPGQEARVTLSIAVPGSADPGSYVVMASANSAASSLASEGAASVTVSKPAPPPCTAGTPSLGVSATNVTVTAGAAIQLTLAAGNTNSASCEAETFGLGAAVPSGWSLSLGNSAVTLASGAQGPTALVVQVPSSQEAGTFQIGTGITGATSGLRAAQVVNVTVEAPVQSPTPSPEPTPTPPVTPEKPATSTSTGQTVQLGIVVSKKNRGTVVVSDTGQSCRNRCSFGMPQSSTPTITLTATASGKSAFAGWGGACSGLEPTCTVTMDGDKSVTALFVKRKK